MMNKYQKEYINRINRVLDYVEKNLDKELSLKTISKVALFSPFHFHRIFYAFTGEKVNEFVKRKRIEKAASLLINSTENISNIAYYCGFNNVSVFCRNFKSHFNKSAQEFRKEYLIQKSKNSQFSPINRNYVCNVESLQKIIMNQKIEIKEMPDLNLVYLRHMGDFSKISETYQKLLKWAANKGLLNNPDIKTVTVYHDDPNVTKIGNVRQSACITIDTPIKTDGEFGKLTLSAGKYVVGSFEIETTQFTESWNAVCLWLSESGYQPDDKNSYELYKSSHEEYPDRKFNVDICIPVKSL